MKLTRAMQVLFVFVFCATGLLAQMGEGGTTNRAQTFTTLHSFDYTDGAYTGAALVQATNGNLYGTTGSGGANGDGTVFKITPSGTLTTLYNFCSQKGCTDSGPNAAGLVQATNGNFYGATLSGGATNSGTVFKITPSGTLTTLYSFCSQSGCTDGTYPSGGLVQATDGNFYGTTYGGGAGANNSGTLFKITPSGTLTTLYSFCSQSNCTDGSVPNGELIQATNGNLYGTTRGAGSNNSGTVFKVTPSGTLTTLYSFCPQSGCTDGATPNGGLVQATDGNLYGTTSNGGTLGAGTVFQITPTGALTTVHTFCAMQAGCPDGANPQGALVQDTNGTFYGTTSAGGVSPPYNAYGTVYSLSVGLGPFVETQPTSGKVGKAVIILGTNLTGTSSVSFHGTPTTFKVVSGSEIKTAVPAGATTGKVKGGTPHGTLLSNVPFRVLP